MLSRAEGGENHVSLYPNQYRGDFTAGLRTWFRVVKDLRKPEKRAFLSPRVEKTESPECLVIFDPTSSLPKPTHSSWLLLVS